MRTSVRPPRARGRWWRRCPGRPVASGWTRATSSGPRWHPCPVPAPHRRSIADSWPMDRSCAARNQPPSPPRSSVTPTVPVAGGSHSQVDSCPRAMASRSPNTELDVAGPPAPGPRNATRPTGSPTTSTRFRMPSCRAQRRRGPHGHGADSRPERPVMVTLRSCHQLDGQAQPGGATEFRVRDARDAGGAVTPGAGGGPAQRRRVDPGAEREPGEQGELVRRVVGLHVTARIDLRIAASLGLAQDIRVAPSFPRHGGQDVVRRAVDDPPDGVDLVGCQVDDQRPEDGHPARDRGLEPQADTRLACHRLQHRPGGRQERLVARDHVLAGSDGRPHQLTRRRHAADELDHDIDIWVGHQRSEVVRQPHRVRQRQAPLASWVTDTHHPELGCADAARIHGCPPPGVYELGGDRARHAAQA